MTDQCEREQTTPGGHKIEAEHAWPEGVFSGPCICGALEWSPEMQRQLEDARQWINKNEDEPHWNILQVKYVGGGTIAVRRDRPSIIDLMMEPR